MATRHNIAYLRVVRTALYYLLYVTLLILIVGGIFLGAQFYPDETTFGMFAFVGLCAVWSLNRPVFPGDLLAKNSGGFVVGV